MKAYKNNRSLESFRGSFAPRKKKIARGVMAEMPPPTEAVEVVVVGAGIAGLATALALKKVGVRRVVVLERAPQLRSTGAALSLFSNAWRALAALGVAQKLIPLYSTFKTGKVNNLEDGTTTEMLFGTPDREEMGVRAVHRKVLLEALAEELPAGTIRFSSRLSSITTRTPGDDSSTSITVLHLEDGSSIAAKVLIGCDGVGSAVAKWLGLRAAVNSGRSAVRGLSVYPEGHGFGHEVHQFVGCGRRAGYVPLNDKELYWFIAYTSTPGEEEEIAGDPKLILNYVMETKAKDLPAKFLDVVRHTDLSTLSWAPLLLRLPWDLILGQTYKANVTVAGDAMHPMTPDLGQGGCSALEDAVVLGRKIAECVHLDGGIEPRGVEGCIKKYVQERRWRAAGLIAGSYVSGWVQQGGSGWRGWAVNLVRDKVFYGFLFKKIVDFIHYDCGDLPTITMREH